MTSKRAYAVAALFLSASLPLGACSPADSTPGEAKPKASETAYPQPAYKVTHEQLRAVLTVGQRFSDNTNSRPVRAEAVYVGFCDDGYTGTQSRSWFTNDEVVAPGEGVPPGLAGNDTTQIGWTFISTTLLDNSPSAAEVIDERFKRWSTCQPKDEPALTTLRVAISGTASSVVRTQHLKSVSPWNAHAASGVARVENALISCTVKARTAKLALGTVTSCLTEMAQAVPLAAERDVPVTDANRVVATKMLLARTPVAGQEASVRARGSASQPCATSEKTFLPAEATFGLIQTEVPLEVEDPATAKVSEILGVLTAQHLSSPAAAQAKVAEARRTFGSCRGTFSKGQAPYIRKGKVTGVADAAYGDGGFTITTTQQFTGQTRVETVQDSIFSVGPYVIDMTGTTPKTAAALAARLKVVAGS